MSVPPFDESGNLPPGAHKLDWQEMIARFGQTSRRKWLLEGLAAAIQALAQAGCQTIFLDGSFATAKESPKDYDVCWSLAGVDLHKLHALEPVFFQFHDGRAAQKSRFRGEFFPGDMTEAGSGRTFLAFFQTDPSTGDRKGILQLAIALSYP